MTRVECEEKISLLMKEIKKVYDEYTKEEEIEDDYLTLTIYGAKICFNNSYWDHEKGKIRYYEDI